MDVANESLEEIVQDNMVCLLCLQVPKEWFVIRNCSCRFCLQVIFDYTNLGDLN